MSVLLTALLSLTGDPIEVPSPVHNMSTTFEAGGIEVRGEGWGVGLSLSEWGRLGSMVPTGAAKPEVDGDRISYDHGPVTEWYVGDSRGLEQGFTVASRPTGKGPLRLVLSVDGGVSAEVMRGARDADFLNAEGAAVLSYVDLRVWDADGRELEARLVAEAERLAIVVADDDAIYPVTIDPWIGTELTVLLPNYPERRRNGDSVALSGDTLVAGAPLTGQNRGAVFVWERNEGGPNAWGQTKSIGGLNNYSEFGDSVAIDGDTIVVGEPADGSWSSGDAAAYVFERDQGGPGAWGQVRMVPGNQTDDAFGRCVAISGDTVAIGAPDEVIEADREGAVYLYGRDQGGPGAWGLVVRIESSTATASDEWDSFGSAVALDGDRLVVGSPGDSLVASYAGAAFVFERNQGGPDAWGEVQQLRVAGLTSANGFAISLALEGDTLLIGDTGDDHSGLANPGAVHVFERDAGVWSAVQKLTASVPQQAAFFGTVSLSGDAALIGAYGDDGPVEEEIGAAYLFRRQGGSWVEIQKLAAGTPQRDAHFGTGVAIEGDTGVVGAPDVHLGFAVGNVRALAVDSSTGTIYAADSIDQLVTLDPVTGVGTPVGPIGFGNIRGLAFDSNGGALYGVEIGGNQLIAIDTATGAGTAVGPIGFGSVQSLAFDPGANVLYGCSKPSDMFLSIDPATGVGTAIGPTGDLVTGLAFDTSTNTLYGVDLIWDELVTVDTSTGTLTSVGKLGFPNVLCLAVDSTVGQLYASDTTKKKLIAVDSVTGSGVGIGVMSTLESGAGSTYVFGFSFETESYCTAGTSASGCQALIGATGVASATAPSGFSLTITGIEGDKDGLYFYGTNGRQANPWGSGTSYVCVIPPRWRGGLLAGVGTAGACDGSFSQDLNARWCPTCPKPVHNPGAGALVQAQMWYRDPQSTSNQTSSMSDAIEFLVGP